MTISQQQLEQWQHLYDEATSCETDSSYFGYACIKFEEESYKAVPELLKEVKRLTEENRNLQVDLTFFMNKVYKLEGGE